MTIANPAGLFEALDWRQYACQCSQHREPCPNRATHVVHIHALNACNEPGLDPYGNRVEIRCYECLLRLRAEVGIRLHDQVSQWGIGVCEGCGAPIVTTNDVVRGWEELR